LPQQKWGRAGSAAGSPTGGVALARSGSALSRSDSLVSGMVVRLKRASQWPGRWFTAAGAVRGAPSTAVREDPNPATAPAGTGGKTTAPPLPQLVVAGGSTQLRGPADVSWPSSGGGRSSRGTRGAAAGSARVSAVGPGGGADDEVCATAASAAKTTTKNR